MPAHLILRLEAPLQAWGDVALDPRRPTRSFPSRSALAGLMASALGWEYRDGARTTALQDALRYAVREDIPPRVLRDYQTADLGREKQGWTRWGIEKREGTVADGTQILEKHYLADGSFAVALTLGAPAPTSLDELGAALLRPARPLFLGRRNCPPAAPLMEARIEATTPYDALRRAPLSPRLGADPPGRLRCWYEPGAGPDEGEAREVWDRRDFATDRFGGARRIVEGWIEPDPALEAVP